jgi:hypothetical protein
LGSEAGKSFSAPLLASGLAWPARLWLQGAGQVRECTAQEARIISEAAEASVAQAAQQTTYDLPAMTVVDV